MACQAWGTAWSGFSIDREPWLHYAEWAARYGTTGKKLHDLQLLATASAAGLDALLTANQNDFPKPPPLQILPLEETAG